MGWFGRGTKAAWHQLSEEIGAELVRGGFWKGDKVRHQVGPWSIVLDTYTESSGENHTTYTRMRAAFLAPVGFRFTIYRKGPFSGLGKMLGMQDIEIGDPEFDEAFIIQSNDEGGIRELLSDPTLRRFIQAQPRIQLAIKDNEGWPGTKFPEDVDELQFLAHGFIKDVKQLKALFELFTVTLEQLCRIRAATKGDAGVSLCAGDSPCEPTKDPGGRAGAREKNVNRHQWLVRLRPSSTCDPSNLNPGHRQPRQGSTVRGRNRP